MWALGEITFQTLTGEATFQNPAEVMRYCTGQQKFPSNRLPVSITHLGHDFITKIMIASPQHRMTSTQCIHHRWMQSLHIEEEFGALGLEQNNPLEQSNPLVQEILWNEPASAQWSTLSSLEHRPTHTRAQWGQEITVDEAVIPVAEAPKAEEVMPKTTTATPVEEKKRKLKKKVEPIHKGFLGYKPHGLIMSVTL